MTSVFLRNICLVSALQMASCATTSDAPFIPTSDYPPDPWVKGYAKTEDCLGGEKLAALSFELPAYPKRAFARGRQGWTLVVLDVDAQGQTHNVSIDRAVPYGGLFETPSRKAVQAWVFAPPKDGPLTACRVLIQYKLGKVSLGR